MVDGGEAILKNLLHGIGGLTLLILAHDAVDDFLRTDSFVMVVDFVASRPHSAGDNMKVAQHPPLMGDAEPCVHR